MNKLSKIVLSLSFIVSGLYAHENTKTSSNHVGNHMHNGVMTNHANSNSMAKKQMGKMQNKKIQISSNHVGNHMHNGVMTNHTNSNSMANK